MTAMNEISKEYGTALFALACEENAKHEYASALRTVKELLDESPEYNELISSPAIPLSDRLAIIEQAFSKTVPEHVLSYLQLICEKGRFSCFNESVEQYNALLDASEQISAAKITSAIELTNEEKEKLVSKLESRYHCRISAEYYIDDAMLGGLIVELDGKILDGSLRQRLREVKEVMNT